MLLLRNIHNIKMYRNGFLLYFVYYATDVIKKAVRGWSFFGTSIMNGFEVCQLDSYYCKGIINFLLWNMSLLIPPNEVEECAGISSLQFVNIFSFVWKKPVCEVTARWNDKSATSKNTVLTDYTPSQNIHKKQV